MYNSAYVRRLRLQNECSFYSTQFKYFYSRIPKVANSSIVGSLISNELGNRDVSKTDVDSIKLRHFRNRVLGSLLPRVTANEGVFKFAVVRCPYARFKSIYFDKCVKEKKRVVLINRWLGRAEDTSITPQEFADALQCQKFLLADRHWAPQTDLMRFAFDFYDLIAPFEEIDSFLLSIMRRIFGDGASVVKISPHATSGEGLVLNSTLLRQIESSYYADFLMYDQVLRLAGNIKEI